MESPTIITRTKIGIDKITIILFTSLVVIGLFTYNYYDSFSRKLKEEKQKAEQKKQSENTKSENTEQKNKTSESENVEKQQKDKWQDKKRNGKNEPHKNQNVREALNKQIDEAKAKLKELEEMNPKDKYEGIGKDKDKLRSLIRKLTEKLKEKGETHSRKGKGF